MSIAVANPGHLNPDQFHYAFRQAKPKEMGSRPMHELRVYGGGGMGSIGELYWHHKTGEIGNISVRPEVQRRGVATAMLGEARRLASETRGVRAPRHSPDRTAAGEAWARSLGERLPKRTTFGATIGEPRPA
jgi:ribosomal protein S18 acetylase RimI-like enzyme